MHIVTGCPLHLTYPSCEVACANDVENLIQTGTSGNIAAFIAEPIQGVGGFITPPKEYFKIVFKIVKKYGGLFMQRRGANRLGPYREEMVRHRAVGSDAGHSDQREGIGQWRTRRLDRYHTRDCLQLSRPQHFNFWRQSSYQRRGEGNHRLHRRRESARERAPTVGSYFRGKLEELQAKHALIGEVRGMGLMQALELVNDRKTKEPAPEAHRAGDGTRQR